jgi:hypothetical protein
VTRHLLAAPAIAALLVLVTGCASDDTASGPRNTTVTTGTTGAVVPSGPDAAVLAGLIAELEVAEPDPARPPYDRDGWEEGLVIDGDCLRTRHEVLAEESTVEVALDGCRVVAGRWLDPLTGDVFTDADDLQVDHLVALADAHRSGAWRWDADRKAAFANDLSNPDHLNAVDGGENQRKADEGPETYRPADPGAACWYATAYARVKTTWDLTVTPAQHDGLVDLLASCQAG